MRFLAGDDARAAAAEGGDVLDAQYQDHFPWLYAVAAAAADSSKESGVVV